MSGRVEPDLDGRRVLVTGASADSDIGCALCVALAGRGARLVLAGRRAGPLEETRAALDRPEQHVAAPFDLTDLDEIPGWMKGLAADGGPFHGVVHSASVQGYTPLARISRAQVEAYCLLNLGTPLLLARGLRQKGVHAESGGALVFIGSAAGLKGLKGRSLYAATKASLSSLARSLALELAGCAIRVNCVAPGVVQGRQAGRQAAMLTAEQNAALLAAHPLGFGEPEDVAETVAFLLSDAARRITGTTLAVDGGLTA